MQDEAEQNQARGGAGASGNQPQVRAANVNSASINENKIIIKFLADSGATEHLTHSKIIFDTFDESEYGIIKCANKDSSSDLKTEGAGTVEIKLQNGSPFKIDRVILASALKENLLSFRKFVDMGLCIYLDDKKIDILDPHSNEIFMSDVYSRPYWLIELETNKDGRNNKNVPDLINKFILASEMAGELNYATPSVTAKKKLINDELINDM